MAASTELLKRRTVTHVPKDTLLKEPAAAIEQVKPATLFDLALELTGGTSYMNSR
jgi:hypothetical protein